MLATTDVKITSNAPLPTWFKIGGRADRLAEPTDAKQLRQCLEIDPALRVLGEGANLLVDDDGVGELVVCVKKSMAGVHGDWKTGRLTAQAGADLPRLVVESVRRGLSGLEGLGGIPASIGGAAIMNAGGTFGQFCDVVARIHALDRRGRDVILDRRDIAFGYRSSGLNDLILTEVELLLPPGDPEALRERLKEVMQYKKRSQPMADNSAGCCFKNPTLTRDLKDIGAKGTRVSAGLLIDRASLKGLRVGGASVSPCHGNFIVTDESARARDVIDLMADVRRRVADAFGVELESEVVTWRRA